MENVLKEYDYLIDKYDLNETETCPSSLNVLMEDNLSKFYSQKDIDQIMDALETQKGGGCDSDPERSIARKLVVTLSGFIITFIYAIIKMLNVLKNQGVNLADPKVIDKLFPEIASLATAAFSHMSTCAWCVLGYLSGGKYGSKLDMGSYLMSIGAFILRVWLPNSDTDPGLYYNITIGGLFQGFKEYILGGGGDQYNIIFKYVEDAMCDYLKKYATSLFGVGGSKKSKKSKKGKKSKKSKKLKKSKKYKKSKKTKRKKY